MEYDITPQERKKMEEWLKDHPIDHKYDDQVDVFDGDVPEEQLRSRMYQKILSGERTEE